SRRRHTRCLSDWSSDVCSSDLDAAAQQHAQVLAELAADQRLLGADLQVEDAERAVRISRVGKLAAADAHQIDDGQARPAERYPRSEERRVGKEGRAARTPQH